VFRGEVGSPDAMLGLAITVALVVLGVLFGTRVFRRESA
jgi:hypothetical protein